MWFPDLTPFFMMFNSVLGYIYRLDEIFGVIAMFIALLISLYSFKIFDFTKKTTYFLFSLSFFLISVGFFVRFIFDLMYQTENLQKSLFLGTFGFPIEQKVLLLGYMFFMLAGYILLLIVAMKVHKNVSLLIFLISIAALFVSRNYYLTFNAIMLIVLSALLIHFDKNFSRVKTLNAGIVWYSFILILFGQMMFLLIFYSNKFYLLGNLFNIGGFLLLLINFLLVLRK